MNKALYDLKCIYAKQSHIIIKYKFKPHLTVVNRVNFMLSHVLFAFFKITIKTDQINEVP